MHSTVGPSHNHNYRPLKLWYPSVVDVGMACTKRCPGCPSYMYVIFTSNVFQMIDFNSDLSIVLKLWVTLTLHITPVYTYSIIHVLCYRMQLSLV